MPSTEELTFYELWEEFQSRRPREKRPISERTLKDYGNHIAGPLKALKKRTANAITEDEIQAIIHDLETSGRMAYAKTNLATIRSIFSWGKSKRLITRNPAAEIRCGGVASRTRYLQDDELKKIWAACSVIGYPFGPLLKLLIVLGLRKSEVAGLRWSQVNLAEAWLHIDETKNDEPNVCPLPTLALEIFKEVPRVDDSEIVFTTNGKSFVSGFSRAKERIDELSGVMDWRIHDLRRTVRTNMPRAGVAPDIAERCLGHKIAGIQGTYDRWHYLPQKRQALEDWATLLKSLVR